jgi:hypothetical protein
MICSHQADGSMEVDGLAAHALQLHKRIVKITRLANCFAMQISSLV